MSEEREVVDEALVLDLAQQIAAGTTTYEQAKRTIEHSSVNGRVFGRRNGKRPTASAEQNAQIDAALAEHGLS